MRLIITSRERQARAIAQWLAHRSNLRIRYGEYAAQIVGNDLIIPVQGQLYRDFGPEDYDERYRTRRLEDLPIVPTTWMRKELDGEGASAALAALRRYGPDITRVLHACDVDREGQLLGDEIIRRNGLDVPVMRLPITGFDERAISDAFAAIVPNAPLQRLSPAATARSQADWIWGINCSRLYKIAAEKQGFKDEISVGRVISPTLHMIAERERAIRAHSPLSSYRVVAKVGDDRRALVAEWTYDRMPTEGFDPEGRLVRRAVADQILARVHGARTAVVRATGSTFEEIAPPRPFTLATLQAAASKVYRYTARQVAAAAESLYGHHHVISYPRPGITTYRPAMRAFVDDTLTALAENFTELAPVIQSAHAAAATNCFDAVDDRDGVTHYAIAPLMTRIATDHLPPVERDVYTLIARNYIAQFRGAARIEHHTIELDAGGERLIARASKLVEPGWRALSSGAAAVASLPELARGTVLPIVGVGVSTAVTEPPARYTDGTLIFALNNLALPDVGGVHTFQGRLGSETSQAKTIERLIEKKLVERTIKGELRPTPLGLAVADSLPAELRGPELSARWERQLDAIAQGKLDPDAFLAEQIDVVTRIVRAPVTLTLDRRWTKKKKNDTAADDVETIAGRSA